MKRVAIWLVIVLVMLIGTPLQKASPRLQDKEQKPEQKSDPKAKQHDQKDQTEDDGQVLKVGAELVTVPFSVTDKKNKYITDIQKDDVTVTEDGKPQEIFSFTKETDLPLTFAILLDISGSQELTIPAQKEAALRFLEKVIRVERDLAAVITFRKDVEMLQGLTSNVK